MLPEDGC